MNLKKYLEKNKITQKEFANLLKRHHIHINKIVCGRSRPSVKLALEIQTLTQGKVKACELLLPSK